MSRKKVILGIVALVFVALIIAMFVMRSINMKKSEQALAELQQATTEAPTEPSTTVAPTDTQPTKPGYTSQIGQNNTEDKDIVIKRKESYEHKEFDVAAVKWDTAVVPDVLADGSSFKNYLSHLTIDMFDVSKGTPLTNKDKASEYQVCIGSAIPSTDRYTKIDDLHNVEWLISKLQYIEEDTHINFTNLHVIGNVGPNATLCMYDWFSVYGLNNTMVLLNNMTGFKPGDVVNVGAYRHNVDMQAVNGHRVVVVNYYGGYYE